MQTDYMSIKDPDLLTQLWEQFKRQFEESQGKIEQSGQCHNANFYDVYAGRRPMSPYQEIAMKNAFMNGAYCMLQSIDFGAEMEDLGAIVTTCQNAHEEIQKYFHDAQNQE